MIVDSHRLGAGEEAADIAAVLTERGLGGDSVDLDFRLDQFRRDRSQRSSSARSLAQRWASQVAATEGAPAEDTSPSTGVMLALAFPDRVARNRGNGSFVLANGRGAAVDQTSALARAPYIAVAELTGTAANGRILLAAPILQADIELRFADQIETADEISFDRGAMALRARRRKTLHAITLSEAPMALKPSAETARVLADGLVAAGLDRLPWSKPAKQWRDRVMFLRKAEGDNAWPDLSDDALAAQREAWLVPALYDKTALKDVSAGDLSDALMSAVALGIARAAGARGADPFRGADRHPVGDRLRGRAGADDCGAAAGTVRAQHPSRRSPKARCRWCWNCCRRRIARCR